MSPDYPEPPESPSGASETAAPARAPVAPLLLLALVVVGWLIVQWGVTRPDTIGASWRECDTQAIARNFRASLDAGEGLELLRPRVDWGGAGDGAVEAELQLYTGAIALAMGRFGAVEWPGQALSLLAYLGAALLVFGLAAERFGRWPALAAAVALLSSRMGVQLSVSVMPDATSLLFYCAGLWAFVRYGQTGSLPALATAAAATALAALIKAPALQLGLVQFLFLLFYAPRRLSTAAPWVAWALVLAACGAQLLHANGVYRETGLTFGVLGGGDHKFPGLEHLAAPGLYFDLAGLSVRYGLGVLGVLSLCYLVVRGSLRALELALLAANAVGLLVSMRYSADPFSGPHYHVHTSITAALLLARTLWDMGSLEFNRELPRVIGLALAAGLIGQFTIHALFEFDRRAELGRADAVRLAAILRAELRPGELVVVRSPKPERDVFWARRNNYEDPTLLYNAGAKGFVLPADRLEPGALSATLRAGARWYAEPGVRPTAPALSEWLEQNAVGVHDGAEGRLWRLEPNEAGLDAALQPPASSELGADPGDGVDGAEVPQ